MALRLPPAPPTDEVAARTPADRDRVVDGVRAAALLVVVLGHCAMAVVAWPDGRPVVGNLLAAYPWTQCLTWVLQVMPLFFLAGGFANAQSWQRHRGDGYVTWLWGRTRRLLRPLWSYLAIMGAVAAVTARVAPDPVSGPLLLLTTQLLWFLGCYLLVTVLTPLLGGSSHLRALGTLLGLLAACALVDALRFTAAAPEAVGPLNFVLVWTVPAHLGALRASGRFDGRQRTLAIAMGCAAVALNATCIALGPYPLSMVGMPGDPVSNMAPPTFVLALHGVVLASAMTLLDRPLARLLAGVDAWRRVTALNLVAMTLYLWHLPALVALTAAGHALHLDRPVRIGDDGFPVPDGWGYAIGSLPFTGAFLCLVWCAVRLLWPLEHLPLPWWDSDRPPIRTSTARVLVMITCSVGVAVGTLMLSATGLAGFPARIVSYAGLPLSAAGAFALLAACAALMRRAGTGADRSDG